LHSKDLPYNPGLGFISLTIRLYEELNRLLPAAEQKRAFSRELPSGVSLGSLIDALGLDRNEIDLALINSRTASFSDTLSHGDRISLYPVFESFDIRTATALPDRPLRLIRFVMGAELSALAGLLEGLGYDCLCPDSDSLEELARISREEKRILLTRRQNAAEDFRLDHCFRLTSANPDQQLSEVADRFQLG